MAEIKKNYFQRRNRPKGPRANHRINSPQVQVINSEGKNLGVLSEIFKPGGYLEPDECKAFTSYTYTS